VTVAGAAELVLVRHGATAAPGSFVDGQSDPPLSARGLDEARRTAARLAQEAIDGLFVTPLRRTEQTAAPLAAATGLAPAVVAQLREVHLGDFEAGTSTWTPDLIREVLKHERWDIGAGAEPGDAFAARVTAGLERLTAEVGPGGRAVAFVHGGVIAEACRQATGSRPMAFLPHLRHASITRLLHTSRRLSLAAFNDVAHLPLHRPAVAVGA
jgi:probable phosphoglycerate mutase